MVADVKSSTISPHAKMFRITNAWPHVIAPMIDIPEPQNAAGRAWRVLDIRRHLLAALTNSDLATFMRVEKGCFDDAARVLYHTMSYDRVNFKMDRTTHRRQIYCDAVRLVDARAMTMTPSLLYALGVKGKNANRPQNRARYLDIYRADVIDLLVPPLREKCRGVRTIYLGAGQHIFGPPFWVVRFASAWQADDPTAWQQNGPNSSAVYPSWEYLDYGHIDYVSTCNFDVFDGPPEQLKLSSHSPQPSATYTVRTRFDIELLACELPPSDLCERWHVALTHGPLAEGIYRGLKVNMLPFSLDILTDICTLQKSMRYTDRLTEIHAYNVSPWSPDDFVRLATVAAGFLTKLDISDYQDRAHQTAAPRSTFADLPILISTIKNHMPSLTSLRFNLGGIEEAEAVCRDMLDKSTLVGGGTIKDLYVLTSIFETPLFNVLRCLSSIITTDAEVEVDFVKNWDDGDFLWNQKAQTEFCRYLKRQSPTRRTHLSVVDFTSTLGITEPLQVLDLTYDKRGRPHRFLEAKAASWSRKLKKGATTAITSLLPKYQSGLLESTEAACRLEAIAADGTTPELLEEVQSLLDAVVMTRMAAREMDVVQEGVEAEIRAYVEALKTERDGNLAEAAEDYTEEFAF